jgi:CubicO group peptidase (beta-lactamase class C family)
MRSGIEWHEQDRPLDETNTTLQLERSSDWVGFTLLQPMDAAPGTKWVYNSGGSQLMSAMIRSATGQTIDRYAQEHLFGPLGIRELHWKFEPGGIPDTEAACISKRWTSRGSGSCIWMMGDVAGPAHTARKMGSRFCRAASRERERTGLGLRLPVVEAGPGRDGDLGGSWLRRSVPARVAGAARRGRRQQLESVRPDTRQPSERSHCGASFGESDVLT